MNSSGEEPVAAAMEIILAYLRAHPLAKDTAEGIAQWWLPPDHAVLPRAVVEQALDRLAATGRIHAKKLPGGAVVYGGADVMIEKHNMTKSSAERTSTPRPRSTRTPRAVRKTRSRS